MSRSLKRQLRNSRGFTLLEVLVAFAILALAIGPILQIFGDGFRSMDVAEEYALATFIAQSKLASIGVDEPIVQGLQSGTLENGFRWATAIESQEEGRLQPQEDVDITAFKVTVLIEWGSPGKSVVLSTLRLASPPAPRTNFGRRRR